MSRPDDIGKSKLIEKTLKSTKRYIRRDKEMRLIHYFVKKFPYYTNQELDEESFTKYIIEE